MPTLAELNHLYGGADSQPPTRPGSVDYVFLILGMRIYRHMKAGAFASAAHVARSAIQLGLIEPDMWRTTTLLNYVIGVDGVFATKRARKKWKLP